MLINIGALGPLLNPVSLVLLLYQLCVWLQVKQLLFSDRLGTQAYLTLKPPRETWGGFRTW